MDIAIPCRCVIPMGDVELFDPGIVFSSADAPVACLKISPASRITGFWTYLGFHYDKANFDLILEVGGSPAWTLKVRPSGGLGGPVNEVFTADGRPAGKVEIQRQAFVMASNSKRATFRDAEGAEVGHWEIKVSLTAGSSVITDTRRGRRYEPENTAGGITHFRSTEAGVIDPRLLLAWCFANRFDSDD